MLNQKIADADKTHNFPLLRHTHSIPIYGMKLGMKCNYLLIMYHTSVNVSVDTQS